MSQETSINQSQSVIVRKKRQPETSGTVLPQRGVDMNPTCIGVKEMVATPTNIPETNITGNYLPQNPTPSGAPTATTQHTQFTPPQNEPIPVNRFCNVNTASGEERGLPPNDDLHLERITSSCISSDPKSKQLTKDGRVQFRNQMVSILENGYDFSSLQIILGVRKDRIANCLADIFDNPQFYSDFLRNKQILPSHKLRGLNGADKSEYWEAERMANGDIRLRPVDLTKLRKHYGIDN